VSQAPDDAVLVHSVQEEYFYMMVHRCTCGGAWLEKSQTVEEGGQQLRHRVEAECFKCKTRRTFHFIMDAPAQGPKGSIRQISSTAQPSRALDAAEWMELARFYLGRIERLKKAVERAQSLLDARQCLEEAMKFYPAGAQQLSPEALWSDKSRQAVAASPETFLRATLEEMLSRIPPMDRLRGADKMEQQKFQQALKAEAKSRVKWWQFWKFFGKS
jgi:hypothetical protein